MPVVLAALAALTYGVADYCGGRASRSIASTAVALWAESAGLLIVLVLIPLRHDPLPGLTEVMWGLATALAAAVGLVAFYRALASGAMGAVSPITAVISAVVPVLVGLALGERPGAASMTGLVLAGLAIALVSGAGTAPEHRPTPRALVLAVVAGFGFAAVFVTLDRAPQHAGLWPLTIARMATLPMIAASARALGESLRVPRRLWLLVGIGGLFDMSANILYRISTGHGLLAIVAVVTAMYPVSTVCLAYVLDHERMSRLQGIGLAAALAALALVAVGQA